MLGLLVTAELKNLIYFKIFIELRVLLHAYMIVNTYTFVSGFYVFTSICFNHLV